MNDQTRSLDAAAPGQFGARILAMADELAHWSEASDCLTCTYFSSAHKAAATQLRQWMQAAGLEARIDAVGNVVGRYASGDAAAKTLLVGSHYDTVVRAGRFDGRLGVLTGIVVIEHLRRTGATLPFNVEVIAFAEEEGARFGAPYLGSGAIAGRFDSAILQARDENRVSLEEVLYAAGVTAEAIGRLARRPESLRGYLEVHIEQGPVLLEKNLPVGIVSSIAGTARYLVTIQGAAGHAGTVPMPLRHDAAAAAAEIILAVERRCSSAPTLVGTVGRLVVPQGLINVIPARCELSLDIRAGDDATRDAAVRDIHAEIERIAARRGVTIRSKEIGRVAAAPCAPDLQALMARVVASKGVTPFHLPSGAGHDAVMFSGSTDIAMLFVRCGNGGISHDPRETVTAEDADLAAQVLLDVILQLPSDRA